MCLENFKLAMNSLGLKCNDSIIADGVLRRFHVSGDREKQKNGWYVLYGGDLLAGAFGCWKRGINQTWSNKNKACLTPAEKQSFRKKMHDARALKHKEISDRYAFAQNKALNIWTESKPARDTHLYLRNKRVGSHGLRIYKSSLLIPLIDTEGKIHSLQFISEKGDKRFLSGGRKKGCYYAIKGAREPLLIAEGYATAATLHEATGLSTVTAFDAGNLKHVASAIRAKHPDLAITICADNDLNGSENVGLVKAKEAALLIGAKLAVPPIVGDFNDYYVGGAHNG